MEYNLSNPYNYVYHEESKQYTFTTEQHSEYVVYFTGGSGYFEAYPSVAQKFVMFGFLSRTTRENGKDSRIFATIFHVLEDYFSKNEEALIFVCDTKDNKQAQRSRLFDIWHRQTSDLHNIDKINMVLVHEDLNLYVSLLVSRHNAHYEVLKSTFLHLYQTYQEKLQ